MKTLLGVAGKAVEKVVGGTAELKVDVMRRRIEVVLSGLDLGQAGGDGVGVVEQGFETGPDRYVVLGRFD